MKQISHNTFREDIVSFVLDQLRSNPGACLMGTNGQETLYASCFAAMTLHYLGALSELSEDNRRAWASYIQKWQDPRTGLFIGPEVDDVEITHPKHNWEHVTMHLTAHALPALNLLGARPLSDLRFAHRFLDIQSLSEWLVARDWTDAWLEGNNLLFMGQFLIHLRDKEGFSSAGPALEHYFRWLDNKVDPTTGLWGTDSHSSIPVAVYGAYHQLLVYHYSQRPVRYANRIIDLVLEMQHPDGSFVVGGGGGACEDVDGVDILVNLYKQTGHRPLAVRLALNRALEAVLSQQIPNSGFVYRHRAPMNLLSLPRTQIPADTADMFSTWFRVHTIALICQVLSEHPLARINWQFNQVCSMGWHRAGGLPQPQSDPWQDRIALPILQKQLNHLWINFKPRKLTARFIDYVLHRMRYM